MTTKEINFLWINLDVLDSSAAFTEPMPAKYIDNIKQCAERNGSADVRLWIDSKKISQKQWAFLQSELGGDVHLMDLRDIDAYNDEPLYDRVQEHGAWRDSRKDAVIWRQVDAAKVLISLQGDYDQTFFADMDFSRLHVDSVEVQSKLNKHGVMFRGFVDKDGKAGFENQLWGFTRERKSFFERLYVKTLYQAINFSENGYYCFISQIREELGRGEGIDLCELTYVGSHDGSQAFHPDHKFGRGNVRVAPQVPLVLDEGLMSSFGKSGMEADMTLSNVFGNGFGELSDGNTSYDYEALYNVGKVDGHSFVYKTKELKIA